MYIAGAPAIYIVPKPNTGNGGQPPALPLRWDQIQCGLARLRKFQSRVLLV
jgi:hypothetical protein